MHARSRLVAPVTALLGITVLLALLAPDSLAGASRGVVDAVSAEARRLDGVVRALAMPLRRGGVGEHRATSLVAAFATALAVLCAWLAARNLALPAARARQAALLVLLTPAALLAGTTRAPHCLHLLAGSVGTLLAILVAKHPRWWAIAALLAVLVLAQAGSAIGALLPLVVLPFWCRELPPGSARSPRALAPGLVLLGGSAASALVLRAVPASELPSAAEVGSYDLTTLLPLVLRDGMRACLPVSVLLLAAALSKSCHRTALALLAAGAVHVLVGCHLTFTLGDDGWFLLPLLPAVVLMLAQWLGPRAWFATGITALVLASLHTYVRFDHGASRVFTGGVSVAAAGAPFVVIPGPGEQEGYALARLPDGAVFRLGPACGGAGAAAAAAAIAPLDAALRSGKRVFLADRAEHALLEPLFRAEHAGATHVLRALQATFEWRGQRSGGFAGHELVAR